MNTIKTPRYIITPKEVFLCKELRPIDTQIYGIIYWYEAMKEGVCFASNNAIAVACGSTASTIKNSLTRLEKCGFIKRTENGSKRKIICLIDSSHPAPEESSLETTCSEQDEEVSQTETTPALDETQSISKNINKNNIYDNLFCLPKELGDFPLKRIIRFYSILWKDTYGTLYNPQYGLLGKKLEQTISDYSEWQIGAFIMLHFEWYGASGEDDFAHKRLAENCFPLEWIPNNVNQYLAYLTNSLFVKMDDKDEVKKHVVGFMSSLNK